MEEREGSWRQQVDELWMKLDALDDEAFLAEMMGKRPGTVRVLHHRALKQLANCGVTPGTDRTVSQGEDAIAA